jgi:hypothetical protein
MLKSGSPTGAARQVIITVSAKTDFANLGGNQFSDSLSHSVTHLLIDAMGLLSLTFTLHPTEKVFSC